jgi:chemotaxis protein histidine kinase CheA/ActR/RegA family two-component response regulator
MHMQSEQQQRIMGYFIEEAKDHLNTIEQGLLNLQSTIEDSEMVNEVFRAAHSVKGGAAMLGLGSIQRTSHRLEDYFKILRECPVRVDQKLETLFLRVFDTLQDLLDQLQGPFGLTDDKADEIMANVEPIFNDLNAHLGQLVTQAGGSPPEDVELAVGAGATRGAARSPETDGALRHVFQTDVPASLRQMLQIFKQAEGAANRQQLQSICQALAQAGESFGLSDWCRLLAKADQAIAHSENSFKALAPLVIRDIKRAQEQILAGHPEQVGCSEGLEALVPGVEPEPPTKNVLVPEESVLDELFADADMAIAIDEPLSLEEEPSLDSDEWDLSPLGIESDFEADLLSEEETGLDLTDAGSENEDWFETAIAPEASDGGSDSSALGDSLDDLLTETPLGDSPWEASGEAAVSSESPELLEVFEEEGTESLISSESLGMVADPVGPEVGAAELNSLADLFEGEGNDLGLPWDDEAMSSDADDLLDALDLETSDDFSDLLFDDPPTAKQASTEPTTNTTSDDISDFFNLHGVAPDAASEDEAADEAAETSKLDDIFASSEASDTPLPSEDFTSTAEADLEDLFDSLLEDEEAESIAASDAINVPFGDAPVEEEGEDLFSSGDLTGAETSSEGDLFDDLFEADGAETEAGAIAPSESLSDHSSDRSEAITLDLSTPGLPTTEGAEPEALDALLANLEPPPSANETPDLAEASSAEELGFDFSEPTDLSSGDLTPDLWDAEENAPETFAEAVAEVTAEPEFDAWEPDLAAEDLDLGLALDSPQPEAISPDMTLDDEATGAEDLITELTDLIPDLSTAAESGTAVEIGMGADLDAMLTEVGEPPTVEAETGAVSDLGTELDGDNLLSWDPTSGTTPPESAEPESAELASWVETGESAAEMATIAEEIADFEAVDLGLNLETSTLEGSDLEPLEGEQFNLTQSDLEQPKSELSEILESETFLAQTPSLEEEAQAIEAVPETGEERETVSFSEEVTLASVSESETESLSILEAELETESSSEFSSESITEVESPEPSLSVEDIAQEAASITDVETGAEVAELTDDDFSDLEALLEEETVAETTGFADTTESDDFADLEALLTPEAIAPGLREATPAEAGDEFDDLEKLLEDAEQTLGGTPTSKARRSTSIPTPRRQTRARPTRVQSDQNMRVSVKNLDNLNNLIGELVVNRNSLEQTQERMRQFLDNLLYQVQQLSDVGQRMRDLYERSLLESSLLSSRRSHIFGAASSSGNATLQDSHATGASFDALEMDRFTGFHTLSQEMIELIVRVRESASDIDFVVEESDQVTRTFRQITTQLQEGLTRARMVPFAQTADRLPRAVRDISLRCGKQAELVVEGRDTLIDKMILEQLYDPMTHLVNNAITHGIEAPEERIAAGKSPVGKIMVRSFHQGNQTVISITDDGAGIDPERVKQKAIEKGLITPEEAEEMTRHDVYDLLFHSGFSTRDKADDFAGRGVGMDVVRTNLNEIRGTTTTDSTVGSGTTFTIRLPLTLSISKALCCISNRARIAFPMDGVEDMLDIPKERIQLDDEGRTCIFWRDLLLPFQPLQDLLSYNRVLGRGSVYGGQEEDIVSIVVLRSAGNFLALQVDQVLGEQEIVIKQLEGPVPKPVGIAGATVLGDGRIMPIADVLELIDLSLGRIRRDGGSALWSKDGIADVEESEHQEPTVLIVDDSITVRELLSMTFTKIGYRVEQARDGQEAWEKLRSGLPCDLVFCDIEMPRMDGLELLSRLQKDPGLNHLPIAMLTSRGADRHRQMAISLGAKGYFTKPYLEEVLLDAAQRMLKGEVLVPTS